MNTTQTNQVKKVHLHLVGPFAVSIEDGETLSLTGGHARAILAMLVLSPDMRRSRRWLEEHLWSTRSPAQALPSLRQALSRIRKALGPEYSDILISDRSEVSLDQTRVSADILANPNAIKAGEKQGLELLEAINVKDPRFLEWKDQIHAFYCSGDDAVSVSVEQAVQITPAIAIEDRERPHVVLSVDPEATRAEQAVARAIGRQIAQSTADAIKIDIASEVSAAAPIYRNSVMIAPQVFEAKESSMVSIELSQPGLQRMIWSKSVDAPTNVVGLLKDDSLISIANGASEKISDFFVELAQKEKGNPDNFGYMAAGVNELFSFENNRLSAAEDYFELAGEDQSDGALNAWRAMLYAVQFVERNCPDPLLMRLQAEEYVNKALLCEPHTATVLGICSQVINFVNLERHDAFHMAEAAMRLNHWNPFAKLAYGIAQLRSGRVREGYQTCAEARRYASQMRHKHWWDMSFALAAMAVGRIDEAIEAAEAALVFHPKFRPPMRHLYALYLNKGQFRRAEIMLSRMRELEPDFSLRMMREDVTYPVVTLRRTALISLNDMG